MVTLLGGRCQKCGYKKGIVALEFHHHKGKKDKGIHLLIKNESRRNLLKETKKCIVLCANCHRALHN